jgi:hypothetical protein
MAFVHGKGVVVMLGSTDLSAYGSSVTFTRTTDSHDVTTFGHNSKVYQGGLKDGTASLEGIYDSTAVSGPAAYFRTTQAAGALVVLKYRPEGTGTSKPEAEVNVLVTSYEEQAPVADMITFTADLQLSGDVDDTVQ